MRAVFRERNECEELDYVEWQERPGGEEGAARSRDISLASGGDRSGRRRGGPGALPGARGSDPAPAPGATAEGAGSPPKRRRLFVRSGASKEETAIRFTNASPDVARLLWIDYQGREVAYTALKQGETALYRSWVSHFWIARSLRTARRLCFREAAPAAGPGRAGAAELCVGTPARQELEIVPAPPMPDYCERTHGLYPPAFREEAAVLLGCFSRAGAELARAGTGGPRGDAPAPPPPPPLAALPFDCIVHVLRQLALAHLADADPMHPRAPRPGLGAVAVPGAPEGA